MGKGSDVARVGERYELDRLLGSGSYGEVYSAVDPERSSRVALKRLHHVDSRGLYRFKKEFRALSRISHPNLVALHELFVSGEAWYLAMELVDGVPLVEFLTSTPRAGEMPEAVTLLQTIDARVRADTDPITGKVKPHGESVDADGRAAGTPEVVAKSVPRDWDRVRTVFVQVAEALGALHAEGMLHRDLKPQNVLVTATGRPVVLDFGLVMELESSTEGEHGVVGTPIYMAPEQATGRPAGPPSDFYALGVMLYEVLTGKLPYYHENVMTLLWAKLNGGAPSPTLLNPEAPDDLASLAMDLLAVEPEKRPRRKQVMKRLGRAKMFPTPIRGTRRTGKLIGRDVEMEVLRRGFEQTRRSGEPVVALVEGESGMGKTVLIEEVLVEVDRLGEAFILRGRCYEQDFVPYKTVDAVVDELSSYLAAQPEHRVAALLPPHALELSRLFPVFQQVVEKGRSAHLEPMVDDPIVAKRRGFAALRELFFRIAREGPVVVFIDDVQWGDRPSSEILMELLRPPAAPPIFWAIAYRADDREGSPFLRALLEGLDGETGIPRKHLVLHRLGPEACSELVARLMREEGVADDALATRIAHEGAGHPLFLEELARYAQEADGAMPMNDSMATPDSVDRRMLLTRVLHRRLEDLPEVSRELLEILSIAGVPVEPRVAFEATGRERVDEVAIKRLRASKLLRTRHVAGEDRIAPYHDRIRTTVVEGLGDDARASTHLRLAKALEASGAPAHSLVSHFAEGRALEKAADYASVAAGAAENALAFHEAAELYRRALGWVGADEVERRITLRAQLAAALVNLGRCREAAQIYEALAGEVDDHRVTEFELHAAQSYFTCGALDEGYPLLRSLSRRMRLGYAKSEAMLNAKVFARIGKLQLRGHRFVEKPPDAADPEDIRRSAVCFAIGQSLMLPDLMRALHHFLLGYEIALKVGDVGRATEAIAMLGSFLSHFGAKSSGELLAQATELATSAGTPEAKGIAAYARGLNFFMSDDWSRALAEQEDALRHFARGRNVTARRQAAMVMVATALRYLERFAELERRTMQSIAEARDVGNTYAEAAALVDSGFASLGMGRVDECYARVDAAQALTAERDMYVQFAGLTARTRADLYRGASHHAHRRVEEAWPGLKKAGLLLVRTGKEFYGWLRAAATLAWSAEAPPKEAQKLRKRAARMIRKYLAGAESQFSLGNRATLLAALAAQRGEAGRAVELLEDGERRYEAAGSPIRAASNRRVIGELLGDEESVSETDERMFARDVAEPLRWSRSSAPGFFED